MPGLSIITAVSSRFAGARSTLRSARSFETLRKIVGDAESTLRDCGLKGAARSLERATR